MSENQIPNYRLNHLDQLEAEAAYIMREVAAQFEKPALLFSGGKDSIVLAHIARKAFWPSPIPFPLVHIDTGHNFPETITYRDWAVEQWGAKLIVGSVQKSIDQGKVVEEKGKYPSRNVLQIQTLLDTIEEYGFDACIGGARRDEEKARAKERVFSVRDSFGQWDPKLQRPELWNIYNGKIDPGENVRVFPISNWTELDVWNYIKRENIALPEVYFAHERKCVVRDGILFPISDFTPVYEDETVVTKTVRMRTVGDMTCTAAEESNALTIDQVITEIKAAKITERGARIDDKRSEAAMEDRKRSGYF